MKEGTIIDRRALVVERNIDCLGGTPHRIMVCSRSAPEMNDGRRTIEKDTRHWRQTGKRLQILSRD
jgi:hypothetical protein